MQHEFGNPFLKTLILKSQKAATPPKIVQPIELSHDLTQIENRVSTLRSVALGETVVFRKS